MKAIVVKPGQKDSIHMRDMQDPKLKPDLVAVKMLRVGLCGTDGEINQGLYGKPPDGDEFLILGHENFGVVEQVGKKVKGFKAGDLVVSTVRRPCGHCYTCAQGENDMCLSGDYQERGIMRRHGFMAEYYVESPEFGVITRQLVPSLTMWQSEWVFLRVQYQWSRVANATADHQLALQAVWAIGPHKHETY